MRLYLLDATSPAFYYPLRLGTNLGSTCYTLRLACLYSLYEQAGIDNRGQHVLRIIFASFREIPDFTKKVPILKYETK